METHTITTEQRLECYEKASTVVQDLYASDNSGTVLTQISKKHNIPKEKYRDFARVVGDVILGFYPQSQIPELLQQRIGVDTIRAGAITTDLQMFLAPLNQKGASQAIDVHTTKEASTQSTVSTVTPPVIPSYRKPLTSVPRYQNPAAVPPTIPQQPTTPPPVPPISTPPSQPPAPPHM
jgi:hypothetical protein